MPRAALRTIGPLLALSFAAGAATAAGLDPHVDPSLVPGGCAACHAGHGESGSPMLPTAQVAVCLRCHGASGTVDPNLLSPGARPARLATALAQPFTHPLDDQAYSADEPAAVTCSSCHSPHRAPAPAAAVPAGERKPSPKDPSRFEYELCLGCHGAVGPGRLSGADVGGRVDPANRSYHPVIARAAEPAPSLIAPGERYVSCSDCHANGDPAGARGPHGSPVRHLLRADYRRQDGGAEGAATYALCYGCHDRGQLLDGTSFPEHREHLVDERTSCSTCHDPHGSAANRALIKIGEGGFGGAIAPSASTGQLGFVSTTPGSGACYLTCHGYDHGPETYGPESEALELALEAAPAIGPPSGPGWSDIVTDRPRPAPRQDRPRRPPPELEP